MIFERNQTNSKKLFVIYNRRVQSIREAEELQQVVLNVIVVELIFKILKKKISESLNSSYYIRDLSHLISLKSFRTRSKTRYKSVIPG